MTREARILEALQPPFGADPASRASHRAPAGLGQSATIRAILQQPTELQEWLLRAGEQIKQDRAIAVGTVAGVPSGLSLCGSQAKPLIDYRKEGNRD